MRIPLQTNQTLYRILLVVLLFSASAKAQIQKTEPPFWYAGMNNPELQIMFYGKNIAQYEPSVSNNVVIKDIKKTENPNYLFVTIDTKNIPASEFVFSFKNKNKVAFTQKYSLKKRRENSAQRKSFDASDMMYLIMPDRFANGNPKNDNDASLVEKANRSIPGGRHGGDIEGIIKNLDYISSLGATTIWNAPLNEDNDKEHSYHTYAQSDVYKIDARYGTNEDYVRLSNEMHKRDMKLVMDYVTNHWGITHWMMKDLPTKSWTNQFENYTQTHHRREVITDIHASKLDKEVCIDGWFVPSMPDLNLKNPLVAKYLTQNAIWWIEYANLDGFRVDTYNYSDPAAMANWAKSVTDEYPNFNIVGEIWMHNQANLAYWQKDSKIGAIQNYNSNLPSVMDFTLHNQIGSAFNDDEANWDNGMIKFYNNFALDYLYPNTNNILVFAENHDTSRINDLYKYDVAKYKLVMTLMATVRGIPQLYYGSEIGMGGDKSQGDGGIRLDFPGGWKGDTNNAFTKEGRTAKQAEYFDFTSKLFNWRKSNEAVHFGKMTHYIPENNTYVYFRYTDAKTVMVVFNNNAKPQTIKTNRFQENIKNFKTGKDILTDKKFDITSEITLEPKSAVVLELE
ncbi:glycoside hydrolase family 13 protein [Flavobacterium branchiarum]|uniref:Glycoside hydrolase family 13 protein n=1 Tax=Flavobacterium branchiarum TaxID=1114870 RepID=A0ABV5FRB0_9FLAO|nr:glycoside hydrolase family 13 protein [Flavobacterium branchiarum]MDN3671482.1 glycoside hydrolase family 13 protein [Flavobacterium branchiarum]MDN3671592.1 glycoside hydrolase family 13 protein [Flavobacterium branchiarum]